MALFWDAPSRQWTGVEVQMKGRNPQYLNGTRLEFHDLHPALWYDVTLKLYSGDVKSAPVSISCQTDPRGEVFTKLEVFLAFNRIGLGDMRHMILSMHALSRTWQFIPYFQFYKE